MSEEEEGMGKPSRKRKTLFPKKREGGIGESCLLEGKGLLPPQSFIQLPSLCRPLSLHPAKVREGKEGKEVNFCIL